MALVVNKMAVSVSTTAEFFYQWAEIVKAWWSFVKLE